jgi:aspartate aminotransferase
MMDAFAKSRHPGGRAEPHEGVNRPAPAERSMYSVGRDDCNRLGITSHGLAMYLLEGRRRLGVACLGGECFGEAGAGFLWFQREPDERLREAVEFLPVAFARRDRVASYLNAHPEFRLSGDYETP